LLRTKEQHAILQQKLTLSTVRYISATLKFHTRNSNNWYTLFSNWKLWNVQISIPP